MILSFFKSPLYWCPEPWFCPSGPLHGCWPPQLSAPECEWEGRRPRRDCVGLWPIEEGPRVTWIGRRDLIGHAARAHGPLAIQCRLDARTPLPLHLAATQSSLSNHPPRTSSRTVFLTNFHRKIIELYSDEYHDKIQTRNHEISIEPGTWNTFSAGFHNFIYSRLRT